MSASHDLDQGPSDPRWPVALYVQTGLYKEFWPRKFSHLEDHYDIDIALNPEREPSKTILRLMEEVLKEAINLARMKGINFLVLIQPSAIDLTKDNYPLGYEYFHKYFFMLIPLHTLG